MGCQEVKPLDEFSPEKRVLDGKKSRCKACLATQARGARTEYFREHYRKNRERRLAWMRENFDHAAWNRSRRLDPRRRIDDAFGMRLYHAIRHHKNCRRWRDIVGYTIEDLIDHLTSKLQPGMTLENYGEWHIDHIVPISAFSYSSIEDEAFHRCWALSNLQPLWAIDNIRKGAKLS